MIFVHNRKREKTALNPDLIARVKADPDTVIFLIDGQTLNVQESMAEILERIANYRAFVLQLAANGSFPEHPGLETDGDA